MSDEPSAPLRFLGVQLGGDFSVGAIVTIDYAGASYKARITARNDDYDDFGNAVPRYNLESIGSAWNVGRRYGFASAIAFTSAALRARP